MSNFTVREFVLCAGLYPDPSSQSVGMIRPGDRILVSVQLGDWSKINGTDDTGNVLTGWIASRCFGGTRRPTGSGWTGTPPSEQFEEVTGVLDTLIELANWRRVKVTSGNACRRRMGRYHDPGRRRTSAAARGGWRRRRSAQPGRQRGVPGRVAEGRGAHEIDAAALAALIDAEAAKITSGPNKGQWDPESFNAASGAAGLTQFLTQHLAGPCAECGHFAQQDCEKQRPVTPWTASLHAARPSCWLFASTRSFRSSRRPNLAFRTCARSTMRAYFRTVSATTRRPLHVSRASRGRGRRAGLHAEQNSSDRSSSSSRSGRSVPARSQRARGDVALAYREWFNEFMDEHIQPVKFRSRNGPSGVVVLDGRPLETFDGAAIPIGQLGGQAHWSRRFSRPFTSSAISIHRRTATGGQSRTGVWRSSAGSMAFRWHGIYPGHREGAH